MIFGSFLGNVRNRINYRFVSDEKTFTKIVSKPSCKSFNVINENVVGVEYSKQQVVLDKPIIVGFCILEISKMIMADFYYNTMKKQFCQRLSLLYTDTDSLLVKIESDNLNEELKLLQEHFDFSNLPTNHLLFNVTNRKIPGKFKDECAGKEISSFVGLRSKMYSYTVSDDQPSVMKAKGISNKVVGTDLTHQDYVDCVTQIAKGKELVTSSIRSYNHQVYTNSVSIAGLNPFDDKRYVLHGVNTFALGHYRITINNILHYSRAHDARACMQ